MIATYNGHMGPIKKKAKQKRLSNHFPKFEMVLEQSKFWMISSKNGFLVQKMDYLFTWRKYHKLC